MFCCISELLLSVLFMVTSLIFAFVSNDDNGVSIPWHWQWKMNILSWRSSCITTAKVSKTAATNVVAYTQHTYSCLCQYCFCMGNLLWPTVNADDTKRTVFALNMFRDVWREKRIFAELTFLQPRHFFHIRWNIFNVWFWSNPKHYIIIFFNIMYYININNSTYFVFSNRLHFN